MCKSISSHTFRGRIHVVLCDGRLSLQCCLFFFIDLDLLLCPQGVQQLVAWERRRQSALQVSRHVVGHTIVSSDTLRLHKIRSGAPRGGTVSSRLSVWRMIRCDIIESTWGTIGALALAVCVLKAFLVRRKRVLIDSRMFVMQECSGANNIIILSPAYVALMYIQGNKNALPHRYRSPRWCRFRPQRRRQARHHPVVR